MTRKERKAKRTGLFSLKAYLFKKAQKRALLLQHREAKRQGLVDTAPVAQVEHVHGENCNHDHEESSET